MASTTTYSTHTYGEDVVTENVLNSALAAGSNPFLQLQSGGETSAITQSGGLLEVDDHSLQEFGHLIQRQQLMRRSQEMEHEIERRVMGGSPIEHLRQIRRLRKEFSKYSKEEFRELSKEPVIKDILTGSVKLTIEQRAQRIKEHLDALEI